MINFIIAFFVYSGLAYTSYSSELKSSPYYYVIGIAAAIIANLLWLNLARNVPADKLVLLGLFWDIMLTVAYLLVPILFFETKLSALQWTGIGVIILGIVMVKL